MSPDQEHLVKLMVAATGLPRKQVVKLWFSTGTFKSRINCGFGGRNEAGAGDKGREDGGD